MSRLRPRLNSQKSQYRDWDRDWIYKSLNVETETETEFTKVSKGSSKTKQPKLSEFNAQHVKYPSTSEKQKQFDQAVVNFLADTFVPFNVTGQDSFRKLFDIADRKLTVKHATTYSRMTNDASKDILSQVVETETHRDWEFLWLSRPRLIETGKFCGCRDRDQPRLNKSCRDRDFIESLADLC